MPNDDTAGGMALTARDYERKAQSELALAVARASPYHVSRAQVYATLATAAALVETSTDLSIHFDDPPTLEREGVT